MGDYRVGVVERPDVSLAAAVAASSAFPPVLSPSTLDIELKASWMVGDTDADVLAGRAAGCHTVLVRNPGSAHKRGGEVSPDAVVGDLAGAVAEILRCEE